MSLKMNSILNSIKKLSLQIHLEIYFSLAKSLFALYLERKIKNPTLGDLNFLTCLELIITMKEVLK